ncbi:protein disulfide oxidoreductase [Photobacterium sagamiensis]|uniref:protein disulfide oxidoreductase n=1 Tax=Photobacterium sagamiensis TaxID=2910241 RepID=UPI003D0D63D6
MTKTNEHTPPKNPPTVKKEHKRKGVRHWLKEGLVVIVLFTVFSTVMDIWRSQQIPTDDVPDLIAQSIGGGEIDLKEMSKNKPVLLYFWATWCPVCNFVSPTVDWMDDHFDVVSVAITSGDKRRLNAYMNNKEYDFPVVNDSKGDISRLWGISATPSIVIIKDGKIAFITTGVSTPPGIWLRMLFA